MATKWGKNTQLCHGGKRDQSTLGEKKGGGGGVVGRNGEQKRKKSTTANREERSAVVEREERKCFPRLGERGEKDLTKTGET